MVSCNICKKDLSISEDSDPLFLKDTQNKSKIQIGTSENDVICYDCAKIVEKKLGENTKIILDDSKVKPTRLLWLVPIFMGLLGGILFYIAVKDQDQRKANKAILVGILSTVLLVFSYVMFIVSFMLSYQNTFPAMGMSQL